MSSAMTTLTSLETLLTNISNMTPTDQALVERAYHKAEAAHEGQIRNSGEPYITHCLAVANLLADLRMDADAISAGLLHDILEDTKVTPEELRSEFGDTITKMVESVTKMRKLPLKMDDASSGKRTRDPNRELEYIRRMLMAMGDDIRVVIVKLADRLHNMRTLGYMPEHKQTRIAKETMDIFAPLANRLGIWRIKWELEDLSFRYLQPDDYKMIARQIDERRTDRDAYVESVVENLRQILESNGIHNATVSGRSKHIYSIYKKMQHKQLPLQEIYDIRAIRIVVESIPQCYLVLGVVHNLWRPITQEFDDYIAAPKDNLYQSLHTAVHNDKGKTIEIQIRTWEMHENAEYGIAAHWRYKEGNRRHNERYQARINDLRRSMEFGPDVIEDPKTFLDAMKAEVFRDRVYIYTPKGDIIDMPAGATPIDFAYYIHTEIGHRCRGAKINGKLVNLNYQLKSGDRVEIITSKRGGPSMDWLNPDRGYAVTSRARSKIRQWFYKLNREHHISLGRDIVERELKRMGVYNSMSLETVAALFDYAKVDDFMAAVGIGDINARQIAYRVLDEEKVQESAPSHRFKSTPTQTGDGIHIMGTGGLLTNIAQCCNPAPGDDITGYITRGRGVTIHRSDCPNILSMTEPERLVDVSWGTGSHEHLYAVPVEITAYNRKGLIRDITTVIADEKVNIAEVKITTHQEIATFHITLEISNNQQLTRILSRVEQIRNVVETYRCNPA